MVAFGGGKLDCESATWARGRSTVARGAGEDWSKVVRGAGEG